MSYDMNVLSRRWLGAWEGANFFLYRYAPWSSPDRDDTTSWILDFKKNLTPAVQIAVDHVAHCLHELKSDLCKGGNKVYMVTVPSHTAYQPNVAGEHLCRLLTGKIPWIEHIPNALVRVKTVPKSASASPGERPTYETHYNSIRYQGPVFRPAPRSIILFDDVYTRGCSSDASRDILMEQTGCQQVSGVYLGKTIR